jgi:hypothetical protein
VEKHSKTYVPGKVSQEGHERAVPQYVNSPPFVLWAAQQATLRHTSPIKK